MATIDLGKVKILWRGTWSAANTYEANDVVTLNGATWICTRGYTAVSGNRKAPGLRDRTNAYGVQFDPDKTPKDTFHVQKTLVSVPVGFKFFIDGRRNPGFTGTGNRITLVKGQTYRFQTYHSSMVGVNFRFSTTTDGTTYSNGVTVVGTPGFSGSYVQITVPYDAPAALYYKQDGTANIADTSYFDIADVWEGFQHWELMSESFVWKGTWSSATQYYRNDVVELDGQAWIAKADNLNKQPDAVMDSVITNGGFPTTRQFWNVFSESGTHRHPGHGAFLPNHGPIDWPYKHTNNDNPVNYRHLMWGTRNGKVYHSGETTSALSGYLPGYPNSYPQEVSFYFTNWLRSRDNMPLVTSNKSTTDTDVDNVDFRQRRTGYQQDYYGRSDLVSPHGTQPRCIQIEGAYDHYLFLFDNGEVHHSGYSSQGQSGAGSTSTYTGMPLRVLNFDGVRIKKISSSVRGGVADNTHHCMALDENGRVWTWGYNGQGQLGTGDSNNRFAPYCIPKEFFNHQRVVDIVAQGASVGSSYVRTESNEVWAWGNNNVGQLGLGDTTNRWRPNRIAAFDPSANGGIIKMMATGHSSTGSFYILDGAGYLWHAGYNGYGQGATADTTNHPTITRSTIAPAAGVTTDFWAVTNNDQYTMVWMRTTSGATYFVGWNAGSFYSSGTGDNVSKSSPTLVPNVTNLKEVWCVWDYSTSYPRTMWLTDRGELWAQGYVNFGWQGNTLASSGSNVEDGTNFRAYRVALPPGTKAQQIWMSSDDNSTSAYGPYVLMVSDNGQIWFMGANQATNGWAWLGGQRWALNIGHNTWTPISKGR